MIKKLEELKKIDEQQKVRNDFEQFYQTKMLPVLTEMESVRAKYLRRFWLLVLIIFGITPAISALCIFILIQNNIDYASPLRQIDPGVYFVGIVILIMILQSPFSSYKQKMKKRTMHDFSNFFGSFKYCYQQTIEESILQKSRLFSAYNRHSGDDYFCGSYKNVGITISEEELIHVTRTRKGEVRRTVFDGILILLDMNKKFKGQTVVLKDWGVFNFLHMLFEGLENVRLEDVRFEKYFQVYSDNQIEARYILTTGFMERILKLKNAYHGKKIQLSFFNNQLLIAISTSQNMFETSSLFYSNLNRKKIDEVFSQFYSVLSIIDILKLNQKLGL